VATLRSFSATEASLEVMASTAVAVEVGLTNHAQHTLNASDAAGQSGRQRKTGKRRPENLE